MDIVQVGYTRANVYNTVQRIASLFVKCDFSEDANEATAMRQADVRCRHTELENLLGEISSGSQICVRPRYYRRADIANTDLRKIDCARNGTSK